MDSKRCVLCYSVMHPGQTQPSAAFAWDSSVCMGDMLQYRGTSLIRTPLPVGPYSSPMPGTCGDPMGVGISQERGTPVCSLDRTTAESSTPGQGETCRMQIRPHHLLSPHHHITASQFHLRPLSLIAPPPLQLCSRSDGERSVTQIPRMTTEDPMWGHPMPVLGALSPFLEPFCGHLSPKLDKVS